MMLYQGKRKLGRGVAMVGAGMSKFGVRNGLNNRDLFLEAFNDLRCIQFKLLQGKARDGESNVEILSVLFDQLQHQSICRQITLLCNALEQTAVLEIIIIVMIDPHLEETISFQSEGLVNLKVKTN